ncbi:MAG: OmpA family protein [Leptospiraceae bacterium]|nr:OmpA family protein [Leptospiraceae bacterium]
MYKNLKSQPISIIEYFKKRTYRIFSVVKNENIFLSIQIVTVILCLTIFTNCSELSFRSDPLSMTMVKYENRSPNKYIFLGHEGDDCHLLRHKRIHNFFFFFPLNSFSKEELQEISQQKMIRYKNIMRLGDFAWTLFLLPVTMVTYSIEVETCNTGMVAVTRRDPLYLEALKNNKKNTKKDENIAFLDQDKGQEKGSKKRPVKKSIQSVEEENIVETDNQTVDDSNEKPEIKEIKNESIEETTKRYLKEKNPVFANNLDAGKENRNKNNAVEVSSKETQSKTDLSPEAVWDSAVITDESEDAKQEETQEEFNPEIYKQDGTLPIIWNYKNSITNRVNKDVKPFTILFQKNGFVISSAEEKKLNAFANEYLASYATSKILLIGHSEWSKGKGAKLTLSQLRAEAVRKYLLEKKIPNENILLSFSGGLWGETNESKFGKKFSRRVDIVFLY